MARLSRTMPRTKSRTKSHQGVRKSIPRYPTATSTAGKRRQVYEGRAQMTTGGLTRKDLVPNRDGKIVSRRASEACKKAYKENGLAKYRGVF
jgi:hypothetical protein